MPFRHSSPRFRRSLFGVLLLALALAQTLGLMHRIVHGPLPLRAAALVGEPMAKGATRVAALANASMVVVEAPGQPAAQWLQQLFAGHDKGHDCRLYDQLTHGDLAWGDGPALEPAALVACPLAEPPGWQLAWQAAGFLARGPPRLS